MSDNIMGGSYGSDDISINIGANLNNIDSSIAEAETLATRIGDWRTNIEAANKELGDTFESFNKITGALDEQLQKQDAIVQAQRELRDISAVSKQNIKDTADYYRDIAGVLSNMSNNINLVGMVGQGAGMGGGGGGGGGGDAGILGGPYPGGEGGEPYNTPVGTTNTGAIDDWWNRTLATSTMNGGGDNSAAGGNGRSRRPGSPPMTDEQARSASANKLLSIPYWQPGGRLAATGRWLNNVFPGSVTNILNKPWIVGNPVGRDAAGNPLTKQDLALQKQLAASGMEGDLSKISYSAMADNPFVLAPEAAGALESAAGVSTGVAMEGGLMGAAGGLMAAAAPVAAAAYLGSKIYGAYSTYQQQGQLLGSLTGDVSSGKMLGYELGAFNASFLNPRLSYGAAKDITMTGLAAGFQGGGGYPGSPASGLLGAYTNFASGAYQNYGMSSQESMGMFQAGVIQAGASDNQLTDALRSLANVSATTNTSFTVLKENFTNFLGTIAGLGGAGAGAIALAQSNALVNAGNPLLGGAGSTASILQGQVGQALAAQQLGISYTQMYNEMGTKGGLQALSQASNQSVLNILANMGLRPGATKEQIGSMAYALPTILMSVGITPPGGGQWTQEKAVRYVENALSNGGTGEASDVGTAKSLTGVLNSLTGKQSGSAGLQTMLSNLDKIEIGHQGMNPNAAGARTEYEVTLNGKKQTLTGSQIMSLSESDQRKIEQELLTGKATVGQVDLRYGHRFGFNKRNTVGALTGNAALQGIGSGAITSNNLQLELGPKAAALFQLVSNPQKLSNQDIKYLSSMGLKTNTIQNNGWI